MGTIIKLESSLRTKKEKIAKFVQAGYLNLVKLGFENETDLKLVRIGTNYGGYWMPEDVFEVHESKSLVSLGLGFDVSLDKALLSKGFRVLGLEPSKSSCEYVVGELASQINNQEFILIESAVDSSTGMKKFERPDLKSNYQWWAQEMSNSSGSALVATTRISDLSQEYPEFFNSHFRILKMDIEGSEIHVLSEVIQESLSFDYLAVELDYLSLIPLLDIVGRLKRLIIVRRLFREMSAGGYQLIHNEGYNFFWASKNFKQKFE